MDFTSESQRELDSSEEIKNLKRIEAALFISGRWLSVQQLVELTDINPLLLRELLEKLRENYKAIESSVEVLEKNDSWKMDVKEEYHRMINRLATGSAEFTKAEQETLAVIAYKQPAKQSVIIKIRGNKAYDHVKHFIDAGLLRAKKIGHTKELSLSESFYDYFHLEGKERKLIEKKEVSEKKIEKEIEKAEEKIEKREEQEKKEEATNEEKEAN